jgi:DNA repair protein RadB
MQNHSESTNFERKISAGSYDLNKWLFGGYERDIITTIYGPAGSGKTNFCILAAASQAKKGNKVIFIDTEGGFSVERLSQILDKDKELTERVLRNIILFKPTIFQEQVKIFNKLLSEIKAKSQINLIVVDGITMLYRLELAEAQKLSEEKIKEVNRELAKQLRVLAEISRNKNIPVIVTNQVYTSFLTREEFEQGREKEVHMVGGTILEYWSKCIIELKNERGKKKAILRKHRSLPEKELSFIITDKGVRRRGFF